MATDTTAGLFGTPEQYQQAQSQQALQNAMTMAQMTPQQQANAQLQYAGFQGGQGIGGAMGAQDPMLQQQAAVQGILKGVDQTDASALRGAAQKLADMGFLQPANALAQRSVEIQTKVDEKQAARAQQEAQFQARLAADIAAKQERNDTMRFIAGAHNDVMQVLAAQKQGVVKPLAPGLQSKEDADLTLLSAAEKQQASLAPVIASLTPDEKTGKAALELGPLVNRKYEYANATGNSTAASKAYAQLKSAADNATNIAIQADKGVATDSDVLRHAKALMAAYAQNDTAASLEALKRFNDAVTNEADNTRKRIDSRRASQGVETYFGTGARAGASNVTGANITGNKVIKWGEMK